MIADQMTMLDEGGPLEEEFWAFHVRNRHVYRMLVELTRQWIWKTGRNIGMKAVFERARWEIGLQTEGDVFNLNNNYTAFYARLIMKKEPDLCGVFQLRNQKIKSTL